MTSSKSSLLLLSVIFVGLLNAAAGEFPDDWFYKEGAARASQAALEGKTMPSLAGLTEWMNGTVTSADIKGKVLVVDFYATWCPPCMAAIPHNRELLKENKDKGLVFLGVCTSSSGSEKMVANARQYGINYTIARDATEKVADTWAVSSYPTYAVMDRKGIVRAVGLVPSKLDDVVKKLLAEPAPGTNAPSVSAKPVPPANKPPAPPAPKS